jgi:DNA invertase Pin-like site-specific DNA recombinase
LTQAAEHKPGIRAAQYMFLAAQYVRMLTDIQADKIKEYAEAHGMEIVRTYADEGKSCLSVGGRPSLKKLVTDLGAGDVDFNVILVYDVSRWGRFQVMDESAHYENICLRACIAVVYCAEQFENDGPPNSTVLKSIKRAMAAEYSRQWPD